VLLDEAKTVRAEINDEGVFGREIKHDAFRDTPTDQLLTALRGKDVLLVFAESFGKGLVEAHGGAAGYHMGQILKLADRVGVARVAAALRRAAHYGAFDHNAVARIVAGKPAKAPSGSPESKAGSATQLDQYLKGTGVHQRSPDGYKRLVGKRNTSPSKPTDDNDKKKEDEGDGE